MEHLRKKEIFKKILVQNRQRMNRLKIFRRDLPSGLFDTETHLIKSLYGPRRSGKTYSLYQIIQTLLRENKASENQIAYLNLEDERILPLERTDGQIFLEAYHELHPEVETPLFFLDEIQNLPQWDAFLRRLYEEKRYRIWVTGSSSVLTSEEIPTRLRGRSLSYRIFPLSFREYLNFKGIRVPDSHEELIYGENFHIKKAFEEYLEKGGFPETVFLDEEKKLEYLQQVLNSIFYRDILERFNIRNEKLMEYLIKFFVENPGGYFSINKTFKRLKSTFRALAKETVINYSEYLRKSMLVDFVEALSPLKERIILPKKIYLTDTGLWWANSGFSIDENRGVLLENVVYLHLARTLKPGEKIFYLPINSGSFSGEIDFVITKNHRIVEAYQVCHEMSSQETREREFRSVEKFKKRYPGVSVKIITFMERIEPGETDTEVTPCWMWLITRAKSV